MRRLIRRFAVLSALSVVAALLTLVPAAPSATAQAGDYVARINGLRASVGLAPLAVDGNLTALAQNWAAHLAAQGSLAHAPDLSAGVTNPNWTKLGENVGMGSSTDAVFRAFVNSAGHYANLVDPAFSYVGVGVVYAGSTQFTAHRFMAVSGGGGGSGGGSGGGGSGGGGSSRSSSGGGSAAFPGGGPAPAPTPTTTAPPLPPPPPAEPDRVAAVLDALHRLD